MSRTATAARTTAAPAQFDRSQQRRRALIAKVHVAKKQLGLDDATYQAVVFDVTGHMSSGDCTPGQLEDLLKRFAARGFTAKPKKAGARPAADHGPAKKARALWISLHHLGVIDNPAEQALEAFARGQLKVDAFQFADQGKCYKVIEGLKAMAARHGWDQNFAGTRGLKLSLLRAILAKLVAADLAPASWSIERAARSLTGADMDDGTLFRLSDEQLDELAGNLGRVLRGDAL